MIWNVINWDYGETLSRSNWAHINENFAIEQIKLGMKNELKLHFILDCVWQLL